MDDVTGLTAVTDLSKGDILQHSMVRELGQFEVADGESMTSIRMLPDHALCWKFDLKEKVEVVFVPDISELSVKKLGKVEIRGFYDQRMENEDALTYVLVSGRRSVIENIVKHRSLGRMEFLKNSRN